MIGRVFQQRILLWIIAVTVSAAISSCSNPTAKSSVDRYNTLFQEAGELLTSNILLDGAASPSADEKEVRRAISLLDEAIALFPDQWPAIFLQGKGWQSLKDHERAYQRFRLAYKLEPNEIVVLKELVGSSLELGRLGEALRLSELATMTYPMDIGTQANHALVLMFADRLPEAEDQALFALSLDRDDQVTKNVLREIRDVRAGMRTRPNKLSDIQRL